MKKNIPLLNGLIVLFMLLFAAGICSASGLDAFKGEKGILRISGGTVPFFLLILTH